MARQCYVTIAKMLLPAAMPLLASCFDPSPRGAVEVRDPRVLQAGGATVDISATVVNTGSSTQYIHACGGSIVPTVELYRDGHLLDTWGAFCLADRDWSPVALAPGARVFAQANVQAVTGDNLRIGVLHGEDRSAREVSWSSKAEFR